MESRDSKIRGKKSVSHPIARRMVRRGCRRDAPRKTFAGAARSLPPRGEHAGRTGCRKRVAGAESAGWRKHRVLGGWGFACGWLAFSLAEMSNMFRFFRWVLQGIDFTGGESASFPGDGRTQMEGSGWYNSDWGFGALTPQNTSTHQAHQASNREGS